MKTFSKYENMFDQPDVQLFAIGFLIKNEMLPDSTMFTLFLSLRSLKDNQTTLS